MLLLRIGRGGSSATRPNYLIVFSRLERLLVLSLKWSSIYGSIH